MPEWTNLRTSPLKAGSTLTRVILPDDIGGVDPAEAWHEIGAAGQPTFQNTWQNFGDIYNTAGFYKDGDGNVYLKGLIKPAAGTSTLPFFTLPVGYRPTKQTQVATSAATGGGWTLATVEINPNGNVSVVPACFDLRLDGVSFRVPVTTPVTSTPTGTIVTNEESAYTTSASGSTSLTSYVFWAIQLTFTKRFAASRLIAAAMGGGHTSATGSGVVYAVLINGVDYEIGKFFFNTAGEHHTWSGITNPIVGVPAGTYNVQLRAKLVSGTNLQCDFNDAFSLSVREVT